MSILRALTVGAFGITIFLAVLVEGMVVSRADVAYLLRKPGRLVRTILAMNVIGPIVAIIVCRFFALHPAVTVALVTLSMTPVGALFPQGMLPLVRTERSAHAHGLFVATTLLSVVLTPLAVEVINVLYGESFHLDVLTVASVAVGSLLLPLGIGLVIGRFLPAAKRWVPAIQQGTGRLFLLCLVGFTILGWSRIAAIIGEGTLTAIAIISTCGLAVGHLLGGPDEDDRTVLAFATVSRHPGVAVAIAVLTREPLAPIGVLLAVVVNEVAVVPYRWWRQRLRRRRALLMLLAGLLMLGARLDAQDSTASTGSANFLLGDWGGFRSTLADKGVSVDVTFTQFAQTISGDRPDSLDYYPNRFDLLVNVATEKAGLWKGGGIGTHVGMRFGGPPTGIAMYPANTALISPTTGEGRVVVTSLFATQRLGQSSSILFGKINLLDLLAAAPFMGGRGIDGFMHIAFAGPPSGVAPVATYGAILTTRFTNGSTFSLLVFDPQDQTGWHKPFTAGVNFSPSVAFRNRTFGHQATHTLAATLSTQEGTDLADLPQVLLPPAQQQIGTRRGPFNINYTYEQYLFQNPKDPSAGWGMFAKAAIADGNPNTLQDTLEVGIGGTALFRSRTLDRFGVGYFSLGLSDALKDFLQPFFTIRRERGFESFYSCAVTRWLRVTGDVQVLPATVVDRDTKVFGAVRTKVIF